MSVRRVHETTSGAHSVRVYRNSELAEYCARLYVNGALYAPADYFTNDKADAIDTATSMLANAIRVTCGLTS